ncbi:hypothetical protein HID58_069439 [Brassica napus]|uniref:Uncharacterized protein n=1 Tax=Brassica napus TaxID=3708 RepID=A0ABQ7YVV0_BRANA|nr:hypothetical protein HID58_069439 [Brassica napus]
MASGFSGDGGGMDFYSGAGRSILSNTRTVIKSDNKIFNRCIRTRFSKYSSIRSETGYLVGINHWKTDSN